ncbi:tetratricopeptide repeat protein [Planobispora takensis]|uniref:tetratricopeptide repeat protein n=1 Tax=Planobispora takensis TaxID=1367882 RepID=UPI001944FC05|nr:tetratricopeptide repeat protein [Planobispora takensis]
MAHVTREHLDRLLERALLADDHESLARRLEALVEAYVSGDVPRAVILILAAEAWRQAGQPARALDCFQRAVDDGGDTGVDPRAGIADTLFELERPKEAREVIAAIRERGEVSPATALTVAETLAAYGDPREAHVWATEGAVAAAPDSEERVALLRVRYLIRVDLGLPEDEMDALLDLSR